MSKRSNPMRIELSGDRRERMLGSIRKFLSEKLEQDVSEFQSERLVDANIPLRRATDQFILRLRSNRVVEQVRARLVSFS